MNFSLIGQKAILINPQYHADHILNFSSTLYKVGKEWDGSLKNYSNVEIVSDPYMIRNHEIYGDLELIKIVGAESDQELWVPLMHLKLESKFLC